MSSKCPVCRQEWDDGQHFRCSEFNYRGGKMEIKDPITGEITVIGESNPSAIGQSTNNPFTVDGPVEGNLNSVPVEKVEEEAKEQMVFGEGKVSDANKDLKEELKKEVNSPASVAETVANQTDEPLEVHVLSGTQVQITHSQWERYQKLLAELNAAQAGVNISDIPTSDPYWDKKKEIDAFVGRLKR